MRFFEKSHDGGKDSSVTAYFLVEIKSLFSIAILRFDGGSRRNFHNHAFDALTWFISGNMLEERVTFDGSSKVTRYTQYKRSFLPKITKRDNLHRVLARDRSWAFTIRGPWSKTWMEYDPVSDTMITMANGRVVVKEEKRA